MVRIHRERGEERAREGTEEEGGRQAEKKGDVTSNRQPMRVREGERERPEEGVFFYHCSISREERGTINFIEKSKKKAQVDKEERGGKKGRKELPEDRSITVGR